MISKMDERRKWKNVNTEEGRKNYRRLNILRTYVLSLWNFKEQGITI